VDAAASARKVIFGSLVMKVAASCSVISLPPLGSGIGSSKVLPVRQGYDQNSA
jgi:hypothetical protein